MDPLEGRLLEGLPRRGHAPPGHRPQHHVAGGRGQRDAGGPAEGQPGPGHALRPHPGRPGRAPAAHRVGQRPRLPSLPDPLPSQHRQPLRGLPGRAGDGDYVPGGAHGDGGAGPAAPLRLPRRLQTRALRGDRLRVRGAVDLNGHSGRPLLQADAPHQLPAAEVGQGTVHRGRAAGSLPRLPGTHPLRDQGGGARHGPSGARGDGRGVRSGRGHAVQPRAHPLHRSPLSRLRLRRHDHVGALRPHVRSDLPEKIRRARGASQPGAARVPAEAPLRDGGLHELLRGRRDP